MHEILLKLEEMMHGKFLFNLSPSANTVSCKKPHYLKDST